MAEARSPLLQVEPELLGPPPELGLVAPRALRQQHHGPRRGRSLRPVDLWRVVREQRVRLADTVDELAPEALDRPSWCDGWRGRDVLGHLVHLAEATRWGATLDVLRHGPKPDRALDRMARSFGDLPIPDLTARLRAAADGRFHVTGSPRVVVLGEVVVHGSDLLRPLGRELPVDPEAVVPLLGVYRRVGRLAFHGRPAGVTLVATDAEVAMGRGPEVRGRVVDLLLLLANRHQVLDAIHGPGVDLVRRR